MEEFLRKLLGDNITVTWLFLIIGFCWIAHQPKCNFSTHNFDGWFRADIVNSWSNLSLYSAFSHPKCFPKYPLHQARKQSVRCLRHIR